MNTFRTTPGAALCALGILGHSLTPAISLAEELHGASKKEQRSLTEITITADPFNHTLLEHGGPASVLREEELQLNTETTIGETLDTEPGVFSSYFGPGASRPVIRGNAGDRIRVLKNGIGTLDVSNTSEDHAVGANPLSMTSIEVLRGPETLLYGNSAIGGVVNSTDNSIPEKSLGKPLRSVLDLRLGSADEERSGAIVLEGEQGNVNWHLDYFHQDTDDIDIPGHAESAALQAAEEAAGEEHEQENEGTLENSATRSQGFTVGSSYVWDRGFFGVALTRNDSKYGVPGHAHGLEHEHEDEEHHHDDEHEELGHDEDGEHHEEEEHDDEHEHADEEEEHEEGVAIDLEQWRLDLRGRFDDVSPEIQAIKFKLGASTYEHEELEGDEVGTRFEQDAIEARVEANHTLLADLDGVLGFQLQASEFSALGDEAFLPEVDTISPAVFLFEELHLTEHLKAQAGLRYEFIAYDAQNFATEEFHPWALSTGLVWDPTGNDDYTLALSFGLTQRAPSASELFADGAHIARQIYELGDTDLGVERSQGVDLTFSRNTGLVTGSVALFVQNYQDYINLSATGDERDEFPLYRYRAIDALLWGFETEAKLHLHEALDLWAHDLDLTVQLDLVRGKNRSESNELPRIPPLRTIVGLEYHYKSYLDAKVEGVFVSSQDEVAPFELTTESYELLNAHVRYNLATLGTTSLSLFLRGTNLTDSEARVHTSFIKDLAPLRGRNFLLGFHAEFS